MFKEKRGKNYDEKFLPYFFFRKYLGKFEKDAFSMYAFK